jgi:fructokinase
MAVNLTIVGLGEALWDLLPGGKALGGAPLNVACHAQQLLAPHGARGVVASRVGKEPLGDELVRDLAGRGMAIDYLQHDAAHPTGTVHVTLQKGQPTFEIVEHVAWDYLEFTPAWQALAKSCAAVCFGTLAQRSPESRAVIWQFLDAAPQAVRLFDVNLRQQFFDRTAVDESCRRAAIVKLNEHELPEVAGMLRLAHEEQIGLARQLVERYNLEAVVLTRGARGTLLVLKNEIIDSQPASYPAAANADAVGAGDACSAGILAGWVRKLPPPQIGRLANHLGAYVASQSGATLKLPQQILEMVA